MFKRCFIFFLFLVIFTGPRAFSEEGEQKDFVWIGETHGNLLMARYLNAEPHFDWNNQIGLDIDILRYKRAFLYTEGNLESVLATDMGTDFDPYNVEYVVASGLRFEYRLAFLSFLIHHECRHDVDRHDGLTEKFNILGFKLESNRKDVFQNTEGFEWLWGFNETFSFGKYVERTHNNYDWDMTAGAGVDVLRYKKMVPYLRADTHLVTQTADRSSGKKYFIDYTLEPGFKVRLPQATVNFFCQLSHRHDVDRSDGITDDFGLLGVRYEW
jgi:hypothetical protein